MVADLNDFQGDNSSIEGQLMKKQNEELVLQLRNLNSTLETEKKDLEKKIK